MIQAIQSDESVLEEAASAQWGLSLDKLKPVQTVQRVQRVPEQDQIRCRDSSGMRSWQAEQHTVATCNSTWRG